MIEGGTVNRQYLYDHKDDNALFLDKNYVNRRLEVLHTAFEKYKKEAKKHIEILRLFNGRQPSFRFCEIPSLFAGNV